MLQGVVVPMRPLPAHIGRPPYAETGIPIPWDEPRSKSPEIIERMRHAGAVAAEILRLAGEMVRPDITTDEIDEYVHQLHIERNAYPSPAELQRLPEERVHVGQRGHLPRHPRLAACCRTATSSTSTSPPTSTACTATPTPRSSSATSIPMSRQLVRVTEECMWHGIEAVRARPPLSDIGRAIEEHAKKHRYGVVRAFIGHGIGEQFHTDIQVLHYYDARASDDHAPGHDVHDRADDHPGHLAAQDGVRRRLDGGHRRRQAHRPVRAHLLVTDDGVDVLTGGPGAASPSAPWNR